MGKCLRNFCFLHNWRIIQTSRKPSMLWKIQKVIHFKLKLNPLTHWNQTIWANTILSQKVLSFYVKDYNRFLLFLMLSKQFCPKSDHVFPRKIFIKFATFIWIWRVHLLERCFTFLKLWICLAPISLSFILELWDRIPWALNICKCVYACCNLPTTTACLNLRKAW